MPGLHSQTVAVADALVVADTGVRELAISTAIAVASTATAAEPLRKVPLRRECVRDRQLGCITVYCGVS